jgi:anaphase-promoting complex subunit 3
MAPTNPYVCSQLKHLIFYHLDLGLLEDALFHSTRLHAYEPRSADAAYLHALCHLRLGQFKLAYEYSKTSGAKGAHLGVAYVFAQACRRLGRYQEGITALERSRGLWGGLNNWSA